MSDDKRFLFLQLATDAPPSALEGRLEEGLGRRGAAVERLPLPGNYEAVLDRLEAGAIPILLK